MKQLYLSDDYHSPLTLRETQFAIKFVKDAFQNELAKRLNLDRITAPLIVTKESGINDDLSGVERKVEFDIKEVEGTAEIVQSLAKWKRTALKRYGYEVGEGLYTDMNAIRRDDDVDNIHSILVDQWDWEKVISREQRTMEYLKETVRTIASVIAFVEDKVRERFPQIKRVLEPEVFFITSQELEDMYPDLSGKERETAIVKEHKTVFIMQIGKKLKSGKSHDMRAPDYDDWELNGDLMLWNETLNQPLEVSSMGIRVDSEALQRQLKISGTEDRLKFPYHQGIVNNELPLTIGGGIGQSRMCMIMLEKMHIGEVQSAIWPKDMIEACAEKNVILL